ncbi:coiled-coil domain-containing protein 170-like [Convolutriloba macropyga]|uniref:coiled-coil domain-containing protein 170-like n=1 Tax=Convolutriloba macropyga TaxID=536237 RepID=UPI003F525D3A
MATTSEHVRSSAERISIENVGNLLASSSSSSNFFTSLTKTNSAVATNISSQNAAFITQNGKSEGHSSHAQTSGGLICHKLYEDMVQKYKSIAEQSQQELAVAQLRIKSLEADLADQKQKVENFEQLQSNSKTTQFSLEENLQKQLALSSSLENSYKDLDEKYKIVETAYHEQKIELGSVLSSLDEKTVQLKSSEEQRIMCHEHIAKLEQTVSEFTKVVREIGFVASEGQDVDDKSVPDILSEIKVNVETNAGVLEKYNNLKATLDGLEQENNAGRATILRLVGELEAEKAKTDLLTKGQQTISSERDQLLSENAKFSRDIRDFQKENETLQQKLKDKDAALEKQLSMMQVQITTARHEVLDAKNAQTDLESSHQAALSQLRIELEKFRNELANAFRNYDVNIDCADNALVISTITEILNQFKQTIISKQDLEAQIKTIHENSNSELQKYELMFKCASLAEQKLGTNSEHIAELESRVTFAQVDVEELASLREKFHNFIAHLSKILKLESIMSEVGLDLNVEAVSQRVQKLADREDATLIEKSSIIRRLEKANRTLRDQLESKELHLDMLRKKLESADESQPGGLHYVNSQLRTVEKQNQVLTHQLTEAKRKIIELKAILQNVREVKLRVVAGGDPGNALDVEWGSETGQVENGSEELTSENPAESNDRKSKSGKSVKVKQLEEPYLRVSSAKIYNK